MSATTRAVLSLDLANRTLRTWGACVFVVDMYAAAAASLDAAGQTYLATVARQRALDVASLL